MKTRNNQFILMSLSLLLTICLMSVGSAQAQVDDSRFYTDSSYYKVTPVSFNSVYADWGAFYHDGTVYFASNRPDPRSWNMVRRADNRTKLPYYTLYQSRTDSTKQFEEVALFAKELGRKYNVGPIYITPNGQKMVVTYNKDTRSAAKNYETKYYDYRLELYTFTYNTTTKKWEDPEVFPYNSVKYNCAHGFMSPDGQYLYFSSDMPGTLGGMDIYVSKREGNKWGVPQNLGPGVNTANNETFPSLSEDGNFLYFSSDKLGGMGGMDIYRTTLPVNSESEVVNLGYPVNSPFDDFGLVYFSKNEDGYFASNRPVALDSTTIDASDNIYHLHSTLPIDVRGVVVSGGKYTLTVVDSLSGEPLAGELSYVCEGKTLLRQPIAEGQKLNNVPLYPGKVHNFTLDKVPFLPAKTAMTPTDQPRDIVVPVPMRSKLVGLVVNTMGVPIPGVAVKVQDSKGGEQTYYTNLTGQFETAPFTGDRTLQATATYKMLMSETEVVNVPRSVKELRPEYAVYMELNLPTRLTIGAEALFDFDKYAVTERAKDTLDMVVRAMKAQPDVTVVLEGHTDSRGTATYNEGLSIRRAKAIQKYLIDNGIAAERIRAVGYGFTRLVNGCAKGVECTEAEHQVNRRVEFFFSKQLIKQ